jgi:hypothetical protein
MKKIKNAPKTNPKKSLKWSFLKKKIQRSASSVPSKKEKIVQKKIIIQKS